MDTPGLDWILDLSFIQNSKIDCVENCFVCIFEYQISSLYSITRSLHTMHCQTSITAYTSILIYPKMCICVTKLKMFDKLDGWVAFIWPRILRWIPNNKLYCSHKINININRNGKQNACVCTIDMWFSPQNNINDIMNWPIW